MDILGVDPPKSFKWRVFLIDNHEPLRRYAAQYIDRQPDLAVCGEASSARAALALIRELHPDLVVTELSLGKSDGLDLIRVLHSETPDLPILVITLHDERIWGEHALLAGARGYLMKESCVENLLPAIRTVLSGGKYTSPRLAHHLSKQEPTLSAEP